jgi:hypothetical protein
LAAGALAQSSGGTGGGASIDAAPGSGTLDATPAPNGFGAAPATNGNASGNNMLSPGANEFGTSNGHIGALPGGTFDLDTSQGQSIGATTTGSGSSIPSNDTPATNFGTGGVQPLPGTPAGAVPGNLGIGLPPATTPGSR